MTRVLPFSLGCLLLSVLCLSASSALAADVAPGAAEPSTPAEVYGQGVRETDWRSPEQERQGFHLPPGFEIRLFASEPQIAKPLNFAFDDAGRMWVTQSTAYPYPDPSGASKTDAVKVLEDTDGDGRADQVTTFADGLNIPIGVLPYGDGCLCYSIPNIWYLRDTDGDGRCDQREVVLGPFDTSRDTHGMVNSLRDGGDGWIYACHGFNNQSVVTGDDGHTVRMHSGNTFRFRPDGSRIEQVTRGQVNPFGMTEDDWGYRYSADCHSKPITQLIRGACYPSFGRPDDGLGFLPPMVDHLHGSTAISGIEYISRHSPIAPLRGQFISGNVMTSRLNRNRLVYHGATAKGEQLDDFLTSDDPWFRPVDIRLGPDGHLYVADFYNKIIGHYEVPLEHPGRDRSSGRIWQIRYVGPRADASELPSLAPVPAGETPRLQAVQSGLTARSPRVRVAALDLAADLDAWPESLRGAVVESLSADHAHVARAAAEAIGRQGRAVDVQRLLDRLQEVPSDDAVLRQTIRIACRDRLEQASGDSQLWPWIGRLMADADRSDRAAELADVLVAVDREEATEAVLQYLTHHRQAANRQTLIRYAAKHATDQTLRQCVQLARQMTRDDVSEQLQLLNSLCDSTQAQAGRVAPPLRDWALEIVRGQLESFERSLADHPKLVVWSAVDGEAGPYQTRKLQSGTQARLLSSHPLGEQYTGIFRSEPFSAPASISFWLAGHNGAPDQSDHGKNRVRLVAVDDGSVLHSARPPRSDTATRIHWDCESHVGRLVRLECIDGDSGAAYAWIAAGQFEPGWLHTEQTTEALRTALAWTRRLGLQEVEKTLGSTLHRPELSPALRTEIARVLASVAGDTAGDVLLEFAGAVKGAPVGRAIEAVLGGNTQSRQALRHDLALAMASGQQREFALAWLRRGAPVDTLVEMGQQGWLSPSVFTDADVQQSLSPRVSGELQQRVEALQQLAPATSDAAAQRSQQWLVRLGPLTGNAERGRPLFTKHCASCHKLAGEGSVVGPQLDGAVTRSAERLVEDIAAPNRNVDKAFHTTSLLLDDGRVLVGLIQSEESGSITLVESSGEQQTIDAERVQARKGSTRSLMPANFHEVISDQQLADLIAYLRSQASS